jgi:signal transduction histidine kinase/CheY-like chemotaxis protein
MSDDPEQHPAPGVTIGPGGNEETRALLESTDWAATPLGPMPGWPASLRSHVDLVMDLPSPAIIFAGPEQTQIYNDGYAVIMGPRHPRYFGAPYRDSWPDTYPLIYPWMRRVLDGGEVITVEETHITVTRHGFPEEAYFTFTFSPLRDDDGRIAGIYQPVIEVTDQVLGARRVEALRTLAGQVDAVQPFGWPIDDLAMEERDVPFALVYRWDADAAELRAAARTANLAGRDDVLAAFDPHARWTYGNNGADEIEDVDRIIGAHLGPWEEPTKQAIALAMPGFPDRPTGVAILGISPRLRLDDRYRTHLEAVSAQLGAAFARGELRQRQVLAREELELTNRRKDEFLAMLGHELRNPLGTIRTGVQLLASDDASPAVRRRAIETIQRQSGHLSRLVDDLLDVARTVQGKVELVRQPLDVADTLRQAVETAQPMIDEHGQRLEVLAPSGDIRVIGDETRLVQVFANLLHNASKFSHEGGSIRVRLDRTDDQAVVEIRDEGAGMAPELISHAFELFVQGEEGLDRASGGLGIGLTLAQRLVELHGGLIDARSDGPGKGSTFTVCLPLADVEVGTPVVPGPEDAKADPGPMRILVVDDHRDATDLMRDLLELDGHAVQVAHDGPTALALLDGSHPDVVLCDIGLPGMDGYELARRIREISPGTALVALTGYGHSDARRAGEEAGFDEYLIKPVDLMRLARTLRDVRSRVPAALDVRD